MQRLQIETDAAVSEDALRRRYTLRYFIALSCIAATILVGAYQLNKILELNEEQAKIINVAGAQRMLSQRVALLAPRVIEGRSFAQRERAFFDLVAALERMEQGHRFLTSPAANGIAPSAMSPELIEHYTGQTDGTGREINAPYTHGIQREVDAFLRSFAAFVADPEQTAPYIDRYRIMAETHLLEHLDMAVTLHVDAAHDGIMKAIHLHGGWVAAAILMLVLEILVVFRPMARNAAKTVSKMSAALENRNTMLSRSMEIAKMGHWRATNAQADPLWISRELLDVYGLEAEEGWIPLSMLQGCDVYDPAKPETNTLHTAFKHAWETGEPGLAQGRFRRPDGKVIDVTADMVAEIDDSGQVVAIEGVVRDITDEAEAERKLRQGVKIIENQRRDLIEAQRIGQTAAWRRRLDDEVFHWDERTYELLCLDPETFEPTLQNVRRLYVDQGYKRINESRDKVLQTGKPQSVEAQMTRGDGKIIDVRIHLTVEWNEKGQAEAFFGTVQDISAEKTAERELEQLAYFDSLTGLANRTLFARQLRSACSAATKSATPTALLLLDLDHFKEVNDGLGHAAGDELLTAIGNRLKNCLDDRHFVSRLGGDEFAIIVSEFGNEQALQELCSHIIEQIGKPAHLLSGEVQVYASIGVAKAIDDSTEPDELMRFADLALYASKEAGRGRASFFKPSMSDVIGQRMSLANEIRHALENDRFEAHYQPVIALDSGKVTGFETLLRLPDRHGGYIPPSEFIPIAESSHLIAELGAFVLHQACKEARAWLDGGLPARSVAVNVSAAQLWHGDLEQIIDSALDQAKLDPNLLCIELTESVFALDSLDRLKGILQRLKAKGITMALDDFGTGYSSLSYLAQLPFDKVKIDRAFVSGIDLCPDKRKMLQGIVSLGHGLGLEVVAEGVESQQELDVVHQLGCECVQGWLFGKAQVADHAIIEAANIDGLATLQAVRRPVGQSQNVLKSHQNAA